MNTPKLGSIYKRVGFDTLCKIVDTERQYAISFQTLWGRRIKESSAISGLATNWQFEVLPNGNIRDVLDHDAVYAPLSEVEYDLWLLDQ